MTQGDPPTPSDRLSLLLKSLRFVRDREDKLGGEWKKLGRMDATIVRLLDEHSFRLEIVCIHSALRQSGETVWNDNAYAYAFIWNPDNEAVHLGTFQSQWHTGSDGLQLHPPPMLRLHAVNDAIRHFCWYMDVAAR